jgi:hypothetical protein
MRFRTWPVAALGLGSLLVLIVVSMLTSSRKAQEIYTELDQLNTHHYNVDAKLRRLRSDVNLSGIFVRDYLLDVAREHAVEYRERLSDFRETNMTTVAELRGNDAAFERIRQSRNQLDGYWSVQAALRPGRRPKIFAARTLRKEVVPRREAILAIARKSELNNANAAARTVTSTGRISRRPAPVAVANRAGGRRRRVDCRHSAPPARAAIGRAAIGHRDAERQMRQLSQRLVETRRTNGRTVTGLHHGPVADGLRMELGRIERCEPW